MTEVLLTATDVARILQISIRKAYCLKGLKYVRIDKLVRVRQTDLDAYILEHLI